jgi:hypothetical protein
MQFSEKQNIMTKNKNEVANEKKNNDDSDDKPVNNNNFLFGSGRKTSRRSQAGEENVYGESPQHHGFRGLHLR